METSKPLILYWYASPVIPDPPFQLNWGCEMKTLIILLLLLSPILCFAEDWTDTEIVNAVYLAEGGTKAKIPYGILSVKVKDEAEARQVCLNTVRNNRKRFADYGHKRYPDYLSFLASRYAPIQAHPLNKNWLKNVKYFLEKNRRVI